MKIKKIKDIIEFRAENKRETELLRELFNGVLTEDKRLFRYRIHSFGYYRGMSRRKLRFWAKRLVLAFKQAEVILSGKMRIEGIKS
jgi:hypothetical protein